MILIDQETATRLFEKIEILERKLDKVIRSEVNKSRESGGLELAIKITGLAKSTIYNKVYRRQIPHSKKRGKLTFFRDELEQWMRSGKVKTEQEIEKEIEKNLKK